MKDPEEKEKQSQDADEKKTQQSGDKQEKGWYEHQQIDEEGNEIRPEDIK